MARVTPGWRHVHVGFEKDRVSIRGVNPWHHRWRNLPEPRIVVAHPQYPRERHEMIVYEIDGPTGPIRFAAGEFSNGVWGFFVPESEASEGDGPGRRDRRRATAVACGALAPAPVILVPYDPDWPRRFEAERALLATVLGGKATIEHVGSTAVPGLGAKPIIDIMVGVPALLEFEARIPDLEARGYEYVPAYEARLPERRYLRKPREGPRTHHVHAVVRGSAFWLRHLLFRDRLRAHPETAAAYFELKRQLAALHRADPAAYSDGKTPFVESVLEEAEHRAGETRLARERRIR